MSNEIIKVLDNLAERFGVAIDWTSKNVMPYMQDLYGRIIDYRVMQLAIIYGICIFALIISVSLFAKLYRDYNKVDRKIKELEDGGKVQTLFWYGCKRYYGTEPDMTTLGNVSIIVAIVLLIFSIVVMLFNICNVVEIINIPEAYVIQIIQNMM